MPEIVSLANAVEHIKDGDHVWSNAFLALANPVELQAALGERVRKSGTPANLTFCCVAGFGDWSEDSPNEDFVRLGSVKSAVLGHLSSTPTTAKMIMNEELEGYNLPLGVMSKMVRAAASGEKYLISNVGVNLFADPYYKGYQLNKKSRKEYVTDIHIFGERRLKYEIPPMDVALIKGSSADSFGNISFEKEATVSDALSLAQAVRRQGGTVIVQVESIGVSHQRPWDIIIPAAFVDYIVVCPKQTQVAGLDMYEAAYAGDMFMSDDVLAKAVIEKSENMPERSNARTLIASRAAHELEAGQLVNIGVGIPDGIAKEAAKTGILSDVCLTVEAGAIKGVPAGGKAFGAGMGSHSICPIAQQFDLYDGGGLDICFIGALEIDKEGNVNGHMSTGKLSGIGGSANITQNTPKVVFCATFTSGGLQVDEVNGRIKILHEGKHLKIVDQVQAVSFSAKNAHLSGQEVLYITERCVFRLGKDGLVLTEVAPGIDLKKDILDLLPIKPKVRLN